MLFLTPNRSQVRHYAEVPEREPLGTENGLVADPSEKRTEQDCVWGAIMTHTRRLLRFWVEYPLSAS